MGRLVARCVLVGMVLSAIPTLALDGQSVYRRALPSVMTLLVDEADGSQSTGTAFLALQPGVAVTAHHVVKDAVRIRARFSDGRLVTVGRILATDVSRDLALIAVDGGSRPRLALATADPPIGSTVYLLGAPRGLEFSFTSGIVNQIRQLDGTKLIQYSAATNPGNSGGPLLNAKGEVVGICQFVLRDSEGLNFAVKSWYAQQLHAARRRTAPSAPVARTPTPSRPATAVPYLIRALMGHEGAVNSATFSPDGKRIVTASDDKTARVWDAATGRLILTLKSHGESVGSAAFSPDGKRIVTASDDKTARVWDAATGRAILTLTGHKNVVNSAAYSPDGTRIISASFDRTGKIWEAATGRLMQTLVGHEDIVFSSAFSPDGQKVVTASWDNTARVWCASTGRVITTLVGHVGPVSSVAFSPDGSRIVTASHDESVRLWDVMTGRTIRTIDGHDSYVISAAFSNKGTEIVTASLDYTAKVWDSVTGTLTRTLAGNGAILYSAAFSPDGKRIVTASDDKTARVWDAATGR